ncbi:peptidase family M20/M25/M40 protein [Aspergillus foveolatus]|uniref:peptidase family M20/M25/M40 protein n=1 Tax=Aspergillus foveolatus TaxID=210207 RepID=UPI003CCC9D83
MSLNTKLSQPSVSERRGHQVAPLHVQTNFSRPSSQIVNVASPLKQRPRPSDFENNKTERVPLQAPHVKRQSSRSSLRHIFSREKPARKSDVRLSGIEEAQDPVNEARAEEAVPSSPKAEDCETPRAAVASVAPTPATPTAATNTPRSKLQPKHRTKTDEEDQLPAEDVAWKPPPLFKAYPQSLKHATLPAPVLSSDSIMRLHATFRAREANLRDNDQQANQPANEEPVEEPTARKRKLDKEKQKYLRALSENVEKGEWTQKVFIIATSGYILQYAGEGKHDRLPEKMLPLGPKSVAFASDAIPGKHWVLQVSQGSEEDSSTISAESSRPILSRFGFHRSHARRLARNMLLVFNDPEEMSSWLLAVRAQIETRGGKKYVSEKVYDEGMESQLRTTPSMRQMVKKDPNRFSAVYLQPRQSMNFEDKDSSVGDQSRRSSYISLPRRSMVMHPKPESRAGSVSTAQTDEEPARFYAAVGSPPLPDSSVIAEPTSSVTGPASPTFSTPRKRQSMFLPQATSSEAAEIPRAQSAVPEAHFRSASPPAPNFSVPLFSKRFAARQDRHKVPRLPSVQGDHPDDTSIDTMSMFSSPPQSPSRDGFAISLDNREQRQLAERRDQNKSLRTSNSEDALANVPRERDRSRLRYSHLPEHIAMLPCQSTSPRRVNVKPVVPSASHQTMPIAQVVNTPNHSDQPSKTDPPSRPSSIVMARRKSMTQLTAGPPSAPPPNIPLPKIPSAFVERSPQVAWSEKSPPSSPVKDVQQALGDVAPISSAQSHLPRTVRSVATRPMNTPAKYSGANYI